VLSRLDIDLPHGGTFAFGVVAVLRGIAVGTNPHVEVLPIRTCKQTFRPMVMDGSRRQCGQLGGRRLDLGRYGKLSTASLSAAKKVLPTRAMPIGEFRS
jgi:hypothetical protein